MEKNGLPANLEKTADNKDKKPKEGAAQFKTTESDVLFDAALKHQKTASLKPKKGN